jgi:hypothetical protein
VRIRSVKPDFFRDEKLSDLETENPKLKPMLVFAGLWGVSDKQGVFPWNLRLLKLDILPLLSFDLAKTLEVLEKLGLIRRFEHENKIYGHVMNFSRHQRINGKEAIEAPKYPVPSIYLPINREATGKQSGSNGEAVGTAGREGKGREGKGDYAASAAIVKIDPLYHRIEQAFLSKNDGKFSNYGKEGKAIHGLMAKAKARHPDDPASLIHAMLAAFWKLKQTDTSSKGFWKGQPFLPSALSSLWDRVLETMRSDQVDPEVMKIIQGGTA